MDETEKLEQESRENQGLNRTKELKGIGLLAVVVSDLLGYSGAGIGLGYLAWAKLGAPWWVLLVFSLAGLILAFYKLYQISQREL